MYSKTMIFTQTFEKTLLHNITVHLINFTKEMQHLFINNMFKI